MVCGVEDCLATGISIACGARFSGAVPDCPEDGVGDFSGDSFRKGFTTRKPSSSWVARFSSHGRRVLPS